MEAANFHDNAQDRILNAARRTFGVDEFSGMGMKAIALDAGVAQGLQHYHFDNKVGLCATVVARRSGIVNAERKARLARVDLAASDAFTQTLRASMEPRLGEGGLRALIAHHRRR